MAIYIKAFQSYSLGYDHYFPHLKSGVGLLLFREQAGASSFATTNIGLAYAYKFRFRSGWRISPGLTFFYTQRNLDFDKLIFYDELETGTATTEYEVLDKKRILMHLFRCWLLTKIIGLDLPGIVF